MSRLLFTVFVIVGFHGLSTCCARADEPFRPTITVTGTSEIRVAPDEVVLSISVESRKKELEKAFEDNDEKIRDVVSLLKLSGVEPASIRTKVIEISPIFSRPVKGRLMVQQQANASANPFGDGDPDQPLQLSVPVPIGYLAKRELSVTIKQLDKFEKIYQDLIKTGVNRVGGISFHTSKLREYRDQARLKAVQAAREKAIAMAEQLEAQVAAVDRITEQDSRYYSGAQNYIGRGSPFGGGEQADSIAAGMMKITATVQVVFLLDKVEFDP